MGKRGVHRIAHSADLVVLGSMLGANVQTAGMAITQIVLMAKAHNADLVALVTAHPTRLVQTVHNLNRNSSQRPTHTSLHYKSLARRTKSVLQTHRRQIAQVQRAHVKASSLKVQKVLAKVLNLKTRKVQKKALNRKVQKVHVRVPSLAKIVRVMAHRKCHRQNAMVLAKVLVVQEDLDMVVLVMVRPTRLVQTRPLKRPPRISHRESNSPKQNVPEQKTQGRFFFSALDLVRVVTLI